MKDNYLPQALYWLTYTIIALFILSLIPPFTVGNLTYKRIDLLADIEPDIILPKADSVIDTIKVVTPVVKHKIDTCRKGVVCIEDFSPEGNAMEAFINSLEQVKSKPIRIAFYGDSFI